MVKGIGNNAVICFYTQIGGLSHLQIRWSITLFYSQKEVNVESFYRMEEVIIAILQEIAEA